MHPLRAEKGFTLVELLVAITVTVVLAGLLITVTSGALNVWQRAQSRLTMNAQVKVAFDLLARDLQAAVRPSDSSTAFAVDVVPPSELTDHNWRLGDPLIKPSDTVSLHALANTTTKVNQRIADARFGQSGIWLRLITTAEKTSKESFRMPRGVSYQVVRRPVSGSITDADPAPIRYTLYRTKLTASNTFSDGYDVASYTALVAPAPEEALCDNVVDFGVWCYVRGSGGSLGNPVYPVSDGDRSYHASGLSGSLNPIPNVVDVMLRVLTDTGVDRLEQMELGRVTRPPEYASDNDWWWAVVESETKVFTMRIEVQAGALP